MELKDWLNSINLNKNNLIDEDPSVEKEYPPFIINKCLSGHLDTVMFANEMNKYPFLPKKMQHDFFIHIVRKKKDSLLGCVKTKSMTLILSKHTMDIVMKKRNRF